MSGRVKHFSVVVCVMLSACFGSETESTLSGPDRFSGTYRVTAITCNGQSYLGTSPSRFTFQIGESTGFYRTAWDTCTYTHAQSYSWSGNTLQGSGASCSHNAAGGCASCTAVGLGSATFSVEGGVVVMTQSDPTSEFGEECSDDGEGGLPARLVLEEI
jgi:hypothetical protein